MRKTEKAVSCFKEGLNCCQAVFSTYATDLGLDQGTALKVSSAFGGGIARMGETCGAVTGGIMLIGLKYGNTTADKQAKERNYKVVREFVDSFVGKHGSIKCKELLACDISTPEGHKTAEEQKLFTTMCPKFVESAALIIEDIMIKA